MPSRIDRIDELDRILREQYSDEALRLTNNRVPPESFWANQAQRFNREWRMLPYEAPPDDRTDVIDMRLASYADYQRPVYNAVFTIPDEPPPPPTPPRPAFDEAWIRATINSQYSDSCWRDDACPACSEIRNAAAHKYDEMYPDPKFWTQFARVWYNLALAHTAAIFMLEVNWNGEKFVNEKQLLTYLPSPTDGAESGGDR